MPFKPLTINTAENVPAHILAQDDAALYSALWGNQSGIAPIWDNLKCDKINDNLVRLGAGVVYIQGHAGLIRRGDTHDVPVVSGSAGQNRIDLIVAEFKRTGATDDILIKVVQGASTSGTPVQPAVTQQDISGAGTIFQLALYSVRLTGTSLGVPVRVAPVLLSAHDLFTRLKSTGATNGASQIAIHDASDKFVASDVEMALSELASADSAIQANVSLLQDIVTLYNGTLAPTQSATVTVDLSNFRLLLLIFSDSSFSSGLTSQAFFSPVYNVGFVPVMYGNVFTYARMQASGTSLNFLASGDANLRLKIAYGLLKE